MANAKLQLDDIVDVRAYERERDEFRRHVIALKKRRRVAVGPFVTFLFENRDTIRFQIQEMARAERIFTDSGIQTELDIYNPLIPVPGQLCATMFIELTSKDELEEWLPKLAGVERGVRLEIGAQPLVVPGRLEAAHADQLTRDDVTASVHYVDFELGREAVDRFADGDVRLVIDHPFYAETASLGPETIEELLTDLKV